MKMGSFRSISAVMMAMAMSAMGRGGNVKEAAFMPPHNKVAPPTPRFNNSCFYRTFTGKRVRNGKKKRNMNHVSKLTRMKHARA